MENGEVGRKAHCLVVPFPLQGHVNPMLQFSKRLKHKGIANITLATTKFFLKSALDLASASFPVEAISDGFDDGPVKSVTAEEYYARTREFGSKSLAELLEKLRSSGSAVDCVIYDPFYQWVIDVAKKFGLVSAVFFTQSNSVNSIYFLAYNGELKVPVTEPRVRLPGGFPDLERNDLPSFILEYESERARADMMINQFKNVEMVDWIFVNTFYELENQVCDWLANILPVRTIGPTIPSMYLDKRITQDKEYGLSAFKPMTDPCMNWLNKQEIRSVIYVSFGSFVKPDVEQIEELALALKKSNMNFLWVVRASEEEKLPKNYKEEVLEKGLIVTWCPQLEVLAHEAIGCFITHCGWNSTLEALCAGVPLVAMPQWSDQSTNAKFVADVWKIGTRARPDEKGIIRHGEIVDCLKNVTGGEKEEEIRINARKWKELARNAVDEGGSSDKNIEEFISALSGL